MKKTMRDFFADFSGCFDSLGRSFQRDTSLTFKQAYVGEYTVIHLRCINVSSVEMQITRVFDRRGNPIEKMKLPYTEQVEWYQRLVMDEGFPEASVMELLDGHNRDFLWRERTQ